MNNFSNYNSNQIGVGMGGGDINYNNMSNSGYSNENFINMGNNQNFNPDSISLNSSNYNGTSLNDLSGSGSNKYEDNNSLIKSLTKEIINNLKENNIDIYDNLTAKKYDDSDMESSSKKKKKKKKNKNKDRDLDDIDELNFKEDLQDYVLESNPVPSTNSYLSWIFNDCFNYKDFLILFTLYFILSQEMIKDFFGKYFTSLNPDFEGKINIQGVIIYGLILTIFYMLIRKLF